MRYNVKPRDVPAEHAAKRIGLSAAQFLLVKSKLETRGFPQADKDTNLYDLEAIDRWCDARNPHLFNEPKIIGALDAGTLALERIKRLG